MLLSWETDLCPTNTQRPFSERFPSPAASAAPGNVLEMSQARSRADETEPGAGGRAGQQPWFEQALLENLTRAQV